MAAQFQFEDQHDPSAARSTMQQGLRSNPTSTHLWLEVDVYSHTDPPCGHVRYSCDGVILFSFQYFRMELMHVDKVWWVVVGSCQCVCVCVCVCVMV